MLRILKRSMFVVAGTAIVSFFLFGRDALTYGKVLVSNLQSSAQDAIPLDMQLDRAQVSIDEVDQQLRSQRERVAGIEVSLEDLEKEVRELGDRERAANREAARLRDAYASTGGGARPEAVYQGKKVDTEAIARRLDETLLSLEGIRQRRVMKEQLLATRRDHLSRSVGALSEAQAQRHQLAMQLETRRVELECARLAGADGGTMQSPGALADARAALARVDTKIRVMKKLSDDPVRHDDLALAARTGTGLLDRASQLLGESPTAVPPAVAPTMAPAAEPTPSVSTTGPTMSPTAGSAVGSDRAPIN